MFRTVMIALILLGMVVIPSKSYGQEEESAEISNEANSDSFQEHFFEGLKAKGIEKYDQAITHFLECKKIEPTNATVSFEIGKCYLESKKYIEAENYLKEAVDSDPENIWFLESLLKCYELQNNNRKAIELAKKLAARNTNYKENLAYLYSKIGEFEDALKLLDELDVEQGENPTREILRNRLKSMISYQNNDPGKEEQQDGDKGNGSELSQIQKYFEDIREYIKSSNFVQLLTVSDEALENYPSQPEFYHARGMALNRLDRFKEAVETLMMGIDYVVDNELLLNNIYRELVLAYQGLGNLNKAREYEQKIKNGS